MKNNLLWASAVLVGILMPFIYIAAYEYLAGGILNGFAASQRTEEVLSPSELTIIFATLVIVLLFFTTYSIFRHEDTKVAFKYKFFWGLQVAFSFVFFGILLAV